jgi:hypothetical protein
MKLRDTRSDSVIAKSQQLKTKMSTLTVAHPHVVFAEKKLAELLRKCHLDSQGMLLSANPGMGKTNFAKIVVKCLSEGVENTPTADKRPVIFIDSPHLLSRSGLATDLLIALGDKSPKKGELGEQIMRIANYCERQEVKLIIIDEIHDFLPKKVDGNTPTVTFLKKLMNATKVPFLFMGTEKAKTLISNHPEVSKRVEERVEFPTFKYGPDASSKNAFAKIVNAYARILNEAGSELAFIAKSKEKYVLQNEPLLARIFFATNGNLRSLRNLFQKLVDRVLDGHEPTMAEFSGAWSPTMNAKLKFNPFEESSSRKVSNLIKKAA